MSQRASTTNLRTKRHAASSSFVRCVDHQPCNLHLCQTRWRHNNKASKQIPPRELNTPTLEPNTLSIVETAALPNTHFWNRIRIFSTMEEPNTRSNGNRIELPFFFFIWVELNMGSLEPNTISSSSSSRASNTHVLHQPLSSSFFMCNGCVK